MTLADASGTWAALLRLPAPMASEPSAPSVIADIATSARAVRWSLRSGAENLAALIWLDSVCRSRSSTCACSSHGFTTQHLGIQLDQ